MWRRACLTGVVLCVAACDLGDDGGGDGPVDAVDGRVVNQDEADARLEPAFSMDVLVGVDTVGVRVRSLDPAVTSDFRWPGAPGQCVQDDDVASCPVEPGCVRSFTLAQASLPLATIPFNPCGINFPLGAASVSGSLTLRVEGCGLPVDVPLGSSLPAPPIVESAELAASNEMTLTWSSASPVDALATTVGGTLSYKTCLFPPSSPLVFNATTPFEAPVALLLETVDGPETFTTLAGTVRVWRVRRGVDVRVARPVGGSTDSVADGGSVPPRISATSLLVDGVPRTPYAASGGSTVTVTGDGPLLELRTSFAVGGPAVGVSLVQGAMLDEVQLRLGNETFSATIAHAPLANPVDIGGGDGLVRVVAGPLIVTGPTGTHEVSVDITAEIGLIVVAPLAP